jgi:glycosyltransferase involved in cell wall biosynthesis
MEKNKTISVIIPIYNAQDRIEKLISSIANQTYKDYEIILVDDCSTDNSYQICKNIIEHIGNAKLFKLEHNSGVSVARNFGIKESVGKYIAFIDADDEVDIEYLAKLVSAMDEYLADLVCCKHLDCPYRKIDKIDKPTNIGKSKLLNQSQAVEYLFNNLGIQPVVWGKLFKRELIDKGKLTFNEDIGISEDIMFVFNYICYIKECVLLDEPLYYYTIDYPNGALHEMETSKHFNPKWLTSWEASKLMTNIAKEKFGTASKEFKIVKCSQISRARMQFHLLYPYKEYKALGQKEELLSYLKNNWRYYYCNDYSGLSRKLMVFMAAVAPKVEYMIWKKRNV